MAHFTLAGADYDVPELSFDQLERAWPFLREVQQNLSDPVAAAHAYFDFLAAIIGVASEELRSKAKAREILAVAQAVRDILVENELAPKPEDVAKGE